MDSLDWRETYVKETRESREVIMTSNINYG